MTTRPGSRWRPTSKYVSQLRKRRRRRGVTLFEVLIVIAILAMMSAAIGFEVMQAKINSDKNLAQTNLRNLQTVAEMYRLEVGDCPSVSLLKEDRRLSHGSSTNDPWGQPYRLTCDDRDVFAASSGPDREKDTDDDLVFPKLANREAP